MTTSFESCNKLLRRLSTLLCTCVTWPSVTVGEAADTSDPFQWSCSHQTHCSHRQSIITLIFRSYRGLSFFGGGGGRGNVRRRTGESHLCAKKLSVRRQKVGKHALLPCYPLVRLSSYVRRYECPCMRVCLRVRVCVGSIWIYIDSWSAVERYWTGSFFLLSFRAYSAAGPAVIQQAAFHDRSGHLVSPGRYPPSIRSVIRLLRR